MYTYRIYLDGGNLVIGTYESNVLKGEAKHLPRGLVAIAGNTNTTITLNRVVNNLPTLANIEHPNLRDSNGNVWGANRTAVIAAINSFIQSTGGGNVISVNGQTGTVSLGLQNLVNVTTITPTQGDVLSYNSSGNWVLNSGLQYLLAKVKSATATQTSLEVNNDYKINIDATQGKTTIVHAGASVATFGAQGALLPGVTVGTTGTTYGLPAVRGTADGQVPVFNAGNNTTSFQAVKVADLSGNTDDLTQGTTNLFFTSEEQSKLAGIQSGAEVNVNADWNSSSGDSQILNKPTLSTVATSGSYNDLSNLPSIPAAYTDSSVDTHLNTATATTGQILSWTGSDYDWVLDAAGAPAGTVGQLQYNNSGIFGASSNLFWDISNSRLGIGTSTPAQSLHILGDIQLGNITTNAPDRTLRITGYNDAKIEFNLHDNWAKNTIAANLDGTVKFVNLGVVSSNLKFQFGESASRQGSMRFYTNSNNAIEFGTNAGYPIAYIGVNEESTNYQGGILIKTRDSTTVTNNFYFSRAGNFGIGTTTPSQKLQVEGGLRFASDGAGANYMEITRLSNNQWTWNTSGVGEIMRQSGNVTIWKQDFKVERLGLTVAPTLGYAQTAINIDHTWNDVTRDFATIDIDVTDTASSGNSSFIDIAKGGTTGFIVDEDFNVGIGTSTPQAKLDINGGSNGHVIFRNSNTAIGNGIRLVRSSSSDWSGVNWYDNSGITWAFGENSAGFGLFEDGAAAQTRLMVKSGGNVGIGTSTPSEKLHVVGNGKFVGQLQVENSYGNLGITTNTVEVTGYGNTLIGVGSSITGGDESTVIGNANTTSYNNTITIGRFNSVVAGQANIIIGKSLKANGAASVIMGYNQSAGSNSVSINSGNVGNQSVGIRSNDAADNSVAIGGAASATNQYAVAIGLSANTSGNAGAIAIGHPAKAINTGVSIGFRAGQNSSGVDNILIGTEAGRYTSGSNSIAMGYQAALGVSATSTFSNTVAVGYQTLRALTTGANNTAVGYQAGLALTTGASNTLIGPGAGKIATAQSSGVVIGNNAGSNTAFIGSNVFIGNNAAANWGVGDQVVAIGNNAAGTTGSGQHSIFIGGNAGAQSSGTDGSVVIGMSAGFFCKGVKNVLLGGGAGYGSGTPTYTNTVAVGFEALKVLSTGTGNVAIGYQALDEITTGVNNTAVGYDTNTSGSAGRSYTNLFGYGANALGNYGTAIGWLSSASASSVSIGTVTNGNGTSQNSIMLGYETGRYSTGNNNVYIGYQTGQNCTTGAGNLFLGYQAGQNAAGSNKLYIENSDSATPLIYGEFDTDLVRINGSFQVTSTTTSAGLYASNQTELRLYELTANGTNYIALKAAGTLAGDITYTLPTADGSAGQTLTTDASGNMSWTYPKSPVKSEAGTAYDLVLADAGKYIRMTATTAITVTIPQNIFAVGDEFFFEQNNTGQVTVAAGTGVTLRNTAAFLAKTAERYAIIGLKCVASNEFILTGERELV